MKRIYIVGTQHLFLYKVSFWQSLVHFVPSTPVFVLHDTCHDYLFDISTKPVTSEDFLVKG